MQNRNIVLLDGAYGTSIWAKTPDKKPVWVYNIERPEVVLGIGKGYVAAGAQVIQANTFGANRLAVAHSSDYTVEEVVTAAVRIAREAVRGTDVQVALSVGPLTQLMEPYGDLTEEEVADIYDEMFRAAMALPEPPDFIALETFIDLEMLRVAAETAVKYGKPVLCTMSFEAKGKTMFGNSVEDMVDALTPIGVAAVGMNCSLGPDLALPIIREFAEKTALPLVFKPNAGKPILAADGTTENPYSAEDFVREIEPALKYVRYVGGCCGTDAAYIEAIAEKLRG